MPPQGKNIHNMKIAKILLKFLNKQSKKHQRYKKKKKDEVMLICVISAPAASVNMILEKIFLRINYLITCNLSLVTER